MIASVLASTIAISTTIAAPNNQAPIPVGWFGPSNYEECILDHMRGVTSDVAANEIRRACLREFPREDQRCNKIDLDARQLSLLEGTGHFGSGYFSADIYNGNSDIDIQEVTIVIIDSESQTNRTYKDTPTYSTIDALSQGTVMFSASEPKNWSWNIVGALGCMG